MMIANLPRRCSSSVKLERADRFFHSLAFCQSLLSPQLLQAVFSIFDVARVFGRADCKAVELSRFVPVARHFVAKRCTQMRFTFVIRGARVFAILIVADITSAQAQDKGKPKMDDWNHHESSTPTRPTEIMKAFQG